MASKRRSCQHRRSFSCCYSCTVKVPLGLMPPLKYDYSLSRSFSNDYGLSSAKVSLRLSSSRESQTYGRFWQALRGLNAPHSATCPKFWICLSHAYGVLSPYSLDSSSGKAPRIESNSLSIFWPVQVHRLGSWRPHSHCSAICGPYLAQLSTKT